MQKLKNNNTPLYILAEKKELGETELMDKETLDWLNQKAKPHFVKVKNLYPAYTPFSVSEFKKYLPQSDWFERIDTIYSIHGLRHLIRVMLYAVIIWQMDCSESSDLKLADVLLAAGLHDIRRLNDNADVTHGERAAKWIIEHKENFNTGIDFDVVALLVKYHEIPDSEIPSDEIKNHINALNLLKDADALDRYIQPKEKWWPDVKFLRCKSSQGLIELAKYFTYETERLSLGRDGESINLIIKTAQLVGILE